VRQTLTPHLIDPTEMFDRVLDRLERYLAREDHVAGCPKMFNRVAVPATQHKILEMGHRWRAGRLVFPFLVRVDAFALRLGFAAGLTSQAPLLDQSLSDFSAMVISAAFEVGSCLRAGREPFGSLGYRTSIANLGGGGSE
jgi:hypothetical protein